jgi:hypothetical protein
VFVKVEVIRKKILPHLPSASGIEQAGENFYVIGDNSAFLFVLDKHFETTDKIRLFDTPGNEGSFIPKLQKPDLEALTGLKHEGEDYLLLLGSGSKSPERDVAFLIKTSDNQEIQKISLTPVYDFLRSLPEVAEGYRLNIEAAAADENKIFLFNRGNISGNNVMLTYSQVTFMDFLVGKSQRLPLPTLRRFELPKIKGIRAGFSGATLVPGTSKMLLTASVEDTPDEIADGLTLGSFAGIYNLQQPDCQVEWLPVMENGKVFDGKVESVAVVEMNEKAWQTVMVTDADGGDSLLAEVLISF